MRFGRRKLIRSYLSAAVVAAAGKPSRGDFGFHVAAFEVPVRVFARAELACVE